MITIAHIVRQYLRLTCSSLNLGARLEVSGRHLDPRLCGVLVLV